MASTGKKGKDTRAETCEHNDATQLAGEVRCDTGANVQATLVDHDNDWESFCLCRALFPNKKDSGDKVARNLKGSIDGNAIVKAVRV